MTKANLPACLLLLVFLNIVLLFPARAEALTCCNPYTQICLMIFDPRCEIDACSQPCREIIINNGEPNLLHCSDPMNPTLQGCVTRLEVVSGSVEVAGIVIQ